MQNKTIATLIEDIYEILDKGKEVSDESADRLAQELVALIKARLKPSSGYVSKPKLRPSNIGYPDRKLYFEINNTEEVQPFTPQQKVNFFFGDIWESMLLWLAEEAGHSVSNKQDWRNIAGMRGKIDAIIDGVVVDVKTSVGRYFNKFLNGQIFDREQDPFGYVYQLSTYAQSYSSDYSQHDIPAAFLVSDKGGRLGLSSLEAIEQPDVRARVTHLRDVLAREQPPEEKCYPEKDAGASGNKELHRNCVLCRAKFRCWENLRVFEYAGGHKYLSHVEKEPNVAEITERFTGENIK